jgi:hypothetical protein
MTVFEIIIHRYQQKLYLYLDFLMPWKMQRKKVSFKNNLSTIEKMELEMKIFTLAVNKCLYSLQKSSQ